MLVRDFMISNPKIVKINDTVKDVIRLLYKYKLDVVPVLEQNNKLVGMVTRTNIIEAIVNEIPLNSRIDSIMTQGVITINPDNNLEEAWQIPVNHLPVIDYDHRIVGMLNRQEFMNIFYSKMCKANSVIKKMINLSYDGIIIVNDYGIIKEINEVAVRLIDVKSGEARNKFIYDILPSSQLMKVIRTGETELNQSFEVKGKTLSVNRAPICEGYKIVGAVAVLRDISQAADFTNQLAEKENRIQALECVFESMPQGIIVVGTDNVINLANTSYEDVMGISREELIGRKAEIAVENSRMHVVLKTGIAELGKLQKVKGRQVVVSRVPIFKEGRIIGAIGAAIFKDISEVDTIIEHGKNLLKVNSQGQGINLKDSSPLITFESIIGRSHNIVLVKNLATKVALSDTTVLIQGESGTGKDLFAQAIHNGSNRCNKKFVAINCAAIPAELLEAELFGYDEGAFTGAKKGGKKGKFEIAEGGTLFLDEIGDMPLSMQAKLLRVMQNKTFEHVGGEHVRSCDVRIIAATNKNLLELVDKKFFREDLYYRLNVICLNVPSLRERQEDIGELIDVLMPRMCHKLGVPLKQFSPEALALLRSYNWPGNVRELINILEQIGATVSSVLITPKQLPSVVVEQQSSKRKKNGKNVMDDEGKHIQEVLHDTNGNKALAARVLGVHRSTLYEKMKKYNLK